MMTVLDYLVKSAEEHPGKVAFSDAEKELTYGQLLDNAKRIATALSRGISGENMPVAVLIGRNVESVVCFMGIAMSRNFYVPIDVTQPAQRIDTILGQMRPCAVISIGNRTEEMQSLTIPVLEYEALLAQEPDESLLRSIGARCMDTDPLYAICTSGSTGVPKGVLISHRSVRDFIPVFVETFGFTEDEIFGNQAPFDFDVSVKDIYSTLYCGATMHIIPKACFSMPKLLVKELDQREITSVIWAVSALCILSRVNAFQILVPRSLKKVLFSGEVMPVKMLNVWRRYLPEAMYVNLYGPTEITCNCMYYIIDREFSDEEKLPLGIPFSNEGVFVLNEKNEPVRTGETGEICVTGTCLALGYYRDWERTNQVFVQNPNNDAFPERMYRTGDLARLSEDGNYYFAARKDFQIKRMGHRIELEEIEAAMMTLPGITGACCTFDAESETLTGFYTGEPAKGKVFTMLLKKIPKYMIPVPLVQIEAFPLNKNGKIDRKALSRQAEKGKGAD